MAFFNSPVACCDAGQNQAAERFEENPILIQQANKELTETKSPGQFNEQFSRTKHISSVETWDGLRIDLNKSLTTTFASSYSLFLGSSVIPGGNAFTFGSMVVEANNKLAMGRISKTGDLDARIHYPIGPVYGKVNFTVGQTDQIMGTFEVDDESSACQVTVGSEGFGFNFNQTITPKLSVGMEMQHQHGESPISVGLGYSGKDWTANSLYSQTGSPNGMLMLQYSKVVSERTQLATELMMNPVSPSQSVVNVGAEFNLKQSKLHFGVNGSGVVDSNIEVKIFPTASMTFAGQLNHAEDKHRFGFGLQMQA
eukprot:CAMPEP_0171457540 /NCGR_PEP_ID=MMETSP0945-20130129/3584_1 /TAXON_ID=109269 /ORGANISM="Vaucheria litorea, Strain CCMP2940" /LENGTH=310 /DNA_ID=CAMNT_0011983181 /DNA_START=179 /DNA_END=1111 /DNA_ORIENTATION=+